jgi:hypothetical protein
MLLGYFPVNKMAINAKIVGEYNSYKEEDKDNDVRDNQYPFNKWHPPL